MRRHQPTRKDVKALQWAFHQSEDSREFTREHLEFLARRRDQFFAILAK